MEQLMFVAVMKGNKGTVYTQDYLGLTRKG